MERTQGLSAKEYEKKLDYLVNTINIPYVMAMAQLGKPPYETVEVDSHPAVSAKLGKAAVHKAEPSNYRNGNGAQFGEEEGTGYEGGEAPYCNRDTTQLTDEEVARIHRGTAKVREALAAAQDRKAHKGDSDK